jgi:anti-sigma factor RsiW
MTGHGPHDPLDLLAWADGRLDDAPGQRAAVEARLAADPRTAARARDWRAQTEALRQAYGPVAEEAIPAHLAAIVTQPRSRHRRPVVQAVAALLLLVAGALGGWTVANRDAARAGLDERFVALSLDDFAARPETRLPATAAGIDWLSDRISLTLRAPDLTALGYTLADVATVRGADGPVARLTYNDGNGTAFALFLRPRWERRAEPMAIAERDGVVMAHWRDGPLTTGLAARLPKRDVEALAASVREALATAFRDEGGMETRPAPAQAAEAEPAAERPAGLPASTLPAGPPPG